MKFQKPLNLWEPGVQEKILAGSIKLQTGQWLKCGNTDRLCRFVSHNGRTINVVHWQGTASETQKLFKQRTEKNGKAKS